MAGISGAFNLIDHHGRPVSAATFAGVHLLVFFGFTNCQVVCPRALGRLSAVLDRLGVLNQVVQPLYISVDPERDTPPVMRAFLEERYPSFLGLTGTVVQVEAAKKSFRVFAERVSDPDHPDGYAVPHTAITYLLGPDGRYIAHFTDATDEQDLVAQLEAILARTQR